MLDRAPFEHFMTGGPGLTIPGPGGPPVRYAEASPALPLSPDGRIAMDAELCRWADPDGPCGCGGPDAPPRICRHPSRPREVRRPDCLSCVTLPDWHGR